MVAAASEAAGAGRAGEGRKKAAGEEEVAVGAAAAVVGVVGAEEAAEGAVESGVLAAGTAIGATAQRQQERLRERRRRLLTASAPGVGCSRGRRCTAVRQSATFKRAAGRSRHDAVRRHLSAPHPPVRWTAAGVSCRRAAGQYDRCSRTPAAQLSYSGHEGKAAS